MRAPTRLSVSWFVLAASSLGFALPAAAQAVGGTPLPARGAASEAQVEILEVSDFQCPYCARVQPTLQELEERYGAKVRLTFVHLPLSFHADARPAAIATVAADRQGRFWEMHDKVFANQRALAEGDLRRYAQELGLDLERFDRDRADAGVSAWIDLNLKLAAAIGVRGTPNFFVNGTNLRGAQPTDKFVEVIDAELAAAGDQQGEAWLDARLKANNPTLHGYLRGQSAVPDEAPAAPAPAPEPVAEDTVWKVMVGADDPMVGGSKQGALVTMVVFSDFQCPFCKRLAPVTEELQKRYGKDLRLVWKNLPLSFHERARPAADAAMCAHEQKKFWRLHDLLFDNQRELEDEALAAYADKAGLKMKRWRACMEEGRYAAHIEADVELAAAVTARGTPNSFINGRKVTGARPLEAFVEVIDEELAKARARVEGGVKRADVYDTIVAEGKVFEPVDEQAHDLDLATSPHTGPLDAPIQVTVFSDFQCPFCARVAPALRDLRKHYGDNLVLAFKQFPLGFHQDARPAALAALCAREQGAFWAFHDLLFDEQRGLGPDLYERLAGELELDAGAFNRCLAEEAPAALIEADLALGRRVDVSGTPTVYLNGRKFTPSGGLNLAALVGAIDKYVLKGEPLPERPAKHLDPLAARRDYKAARELERTDLRKAVELYRQAAEGGYPKAWQQLGRLYLQQGDQQRAAEAYTRYLALSPSAPDAELVEETLGRIAPAP